MLTSYIVSQIYKKFGFTPTEEQKKVIFSLAEYLVSTDRDAGFILNGFAGTGKTTLIASLVGVLKDAEVGSVLMAPTGRAAKVMGYYSGAMTYTIHRKIYRRHSLSSKESKFELNFNKSNDTVYIIDEVSMLSNASYEAGFGSGNLLADLFEYVNSGQRNKIIFIGDSAQLPPVGFDFSPALDIGVMRGYCDPVYCTLSDVVRQGADSGILKNATTIRHIVESGLAEQPRIELSADVIRLSGADIVESIEDSYSRNGKDSTVIITRSNKRAAKFNQGIRSMVLGYDQELESGDMLMVVKNNYQNVDQQAPFEFVANGDLVVVERIYKTVERYGFRFGYMQLRMPDYDDYTMERWVILDALHTDSPTLGREHQEKLFTSIEADYADITVRSKRVKAIMEDEFFNALQVKFAYAVTCHKAQGGQWNDVYIDTMLFGDEQMTTEFARWLYTAVTRAVHRVYFIGWDDKYFTETPDTNV